MEDLWPDDFSAEPIESPVSILREQASALGERTGNLVLAQVEGLPMEFAIPDRTTTFRGSEREDMDVRSEFRWGFYLVVPSLNNYRYRLFTIFHGPELWPVTFMLDRELTQAVVGDMELPSQVQVDLDSRHRPPPALMTENVKAFKSALRKIFGAAKTRSLIAALLSQIPGTEEHWPIA